MTQILTSTCKVFNAYMLKSDKQKQLWHIHHVHPIGSQFCGAWNEITPHDSSRSIPAPFDGTATLFYMYMQKTKRQKFADIHRI